MANRGRKARGMATQRLVAEYFQRKGWKWAYSKGSGESGVDIENMPGLSPEVKATPGDVTGALLQAVKNRGGGIPFVVWRPNGYGPERLDRWPMIFTLEDGTALLRAAGYGSDDET
jgi:hypothetical protein